MTIPKFSPTETHVEAITDVYLSFTANIAIASTGYCMGWTAPVNQKLANATLTPLPEVTTSDQEAWIGSLLTVGAIFGKDLCYLLVELFSFIAEKKKVYSIPILFLTALVA